MAEDAGNIDRGALSPQAIRAIANALKVLRPNGYSCPTCAGQKALIANYLVSPLTLQVNGQPLKHGGTFPQVMVVCERCGFTAYHNAAVLGIGDDMRVAEDE